ncbi:MAG: hypothetical protein CMN30_19785 [Sandaracinus sp.]|nr:hypothetical protein [Sandaracinus sp.]|tara:strand:+ start:340 stop:948 length:609 start_codon:yes stop_codon:yes gene_type:complete
MIRRAQLVLIALAMAAPLTSACGEPETDLQVERLPEVQPNLPPVPTLPPPPHPVTYDDGSHSIYGLRARLRTTIDTDVEVTGYVTEIYVPPECEEEPCPTPAAPHFWMADTRDESSKQNMLMVVGYAENQEQIDEAVELAERGRYEPPDPETGLLPIPTDLHVGNKVKYNGRFARVAAGFNNSEGLLDYRGYETLENVAAEE